MKTKPAVIWVAVASRLMVPFASNVFGAEGGLGRPISGATINPYAGLVPPSPGFAASHHFSQTDHMAFSFTFWAPTGSFETGRLVNLSLNNWTFIPSVAYTKILPQANIELSGIWQMEFYTENPATHFQNGILSDLEALAIKRFKNGFGIGFVESWIQQVTDDEGTAADALTGFVGRAFGIGPIVTYSTKLGKESPRF